MPNKPSNSPLGAFLAALREEKIPCILMGAMAAIEQGAPLTTIDYDFWVHLRERQYIRILKIVHRLHGTIRARAFYELTDGTQVNVTFKPDGLRAFAVEHRGSRLSEIDGERVRVLPLRRVIASKVAAGREKDLAVLPILRRTLALAKEVTSVERKRSSTQRKRSIAASKGARPPATQSKSRAKRNKR